MEGFNTSSFCFGTLYGLIAAGIIALIANRMREARLKMEHQVRTYDKFPDSLHPTLTAAGVARTSQRETWVYAGLSVVLVIFIGLALTGVFLIIQYV